MVSNKTVVKTKKKKKGKKYTDLPIFKSTEGFILYTLPQMAVMRRDYKYCLGERIKSYLLEMYFSISVINEQRDKVPKLSEFIKLCENIRLAINLCCKLNLYHPKVGARMLVGLEDIYTQALRWRNSYTKNKNDEDCDEITEEADEICDDAVEKCEETEESEKFFEKFL